MEYQIPKDIFNENPSGPLPFLDIYTTMFLMVSIIVLGNIFAPQVTVVIVFLEFVLTRRIQGMPVYALLIPPTQRILKIKKRAHQEISVLITSRSGHQTLMQQGGGDDL